MQIESIIQRKGGSTIDLDGTIYHFVAKPPRFEHVATVTDTDHISLLLGIREGFRLFSVDDSEEAPAQADDGAASANDAPVVPDPAPANAPADNGGSADTSALTVEQVNAMDETELRATYKALNGRAAASNAKIETIRSGVIALIQA